MVLDSVYGIGAGLNWLAGVGARLTEPVLGISPDSFYGQMEQWQGYMSPYAQQGYYDPSSPAAQVAMAGSVFVSPGSLSGRINGMVQSTSTRATVLANLAESQAARASSRFEIRTARDFYLDSGFSPADVDSHLVGIDLSRPVTVNRLPPGETVVQYQFPGRDIGNYFAPVGTPANKLGINPVGRVENIWETSQPVSVLRSTAADTSLNFTIPPWARGPGGGSQFFTTESGAFMLQQAP
jgi:hypothetical protein